MSRNDRPFWGAHHPLTKNRFLRYLGYASKRDPVFASPMVVSQKAVDANRFLLNLGGHPAEFQVSNGEVWVTTHLGTRWWPVAKRTKGVAMGREVRDYVLAAGEILAKRKALEDARVRLTEKERSDREIRDSKILSLLREAQSHFGFPEGVLAPNVTKEGRVRFEFLVDFSPEDAAKVFGALSGSGITSLGCK